MSTYYINTMEQNNEFDKLTKEQLLKMYQTYTKLRNKEDIEKLKRKQRDKRYYQSDKGKAKLKEIQKRYYQKNKEKILKKYHDNKTKNKQENNEIIEINEN